jgi:Chromo (CHRromatin Organisation MOdifier) domain
LDGRNLNINYASKKLAPKREGPFEVIKKIGTNTYRLKLPPGWKIHNVFNTMLLSPYTETDTHGPNFLRPPPLRVKGVEEYEVESILAHRRKGNGYQYLIKWKNYRPNDNTWEPEKHLTHAKDTLKQYKAQRMSKTSKRPTQQ